MDFGQKKFFREIDLFDFTSFFFWPGLFQIFWPTVQKTEKEEEEDQ